MRYIKKASARADRYSRQMKVLSKDIFSRLVEDGVKPRTRRMLVGLDRLIFDADTTRKIISEGQRRLDDSTRELLKNSGCSCGGWACARCQLAVSEVKDALEWIRRHG